MIKFNHRPSSLESHMICKAKALMEYGIPNEDTEYTTEGNHVHTLLNYAIYNDIRDVSTLLDKTIKYAVYKDNDPLKEIIKTEKFIVHQQMVDSVTVVLKHLWVHAPEDVEVKTELVVNNTMIQNGATGEKCTIDMVFQDEETLYIWDYKNGAVPVEAEENWQLLSYAKSVVDKIDTTNIRVIDMRIIQPNISRGSTMSQWSIPIEALDDYAETARKVTDEIDNGVNITFAPQSKACTFCKAKSICAKFNEHRIEEYNMLEEELKKFKKKNTIPYKKIEAIYEAGTKFNKLVEQTAKGVTSVAQLKEVMSHAESFTSLIDKLEDDISSGAIDDMLTEVERQEILDFDFDALRKASTNMITYLVKIGDAECRYELIEKEGRISFIDLNKDPRSPEFKKALEKYNLLELKPKTITNIKKEVSDEVWKNELEKFTQRPVSSKLIKKAGKPLSAEIDELF